MRRSGDERRSISLLVATALLLSPTAGCQQRAAEPDSEPKTTELANEADSANDTAAVVSEWVTEHWAVAQEKTSDAWQSVQQATSKTLTVVRAKTKEGTDSTADAMNTAWIWTKDKSVDGWDWIAENSKASVEWASDQANHSWKIVQDKAGKLSLWVQVEVDQGVAWVQTTVPEAWKITKDSSGKVWVWVGDHQVEVATATTIVSIVVIGLIAAPEAIVAGMLVVGKGAVAGTTSRFLVDLYRNHKESLGGVSEEGFVSVGRTVVEECGKQVLSSRGAFTN